nr:hypothetical protein [uncultured Solibaculum sp.]
MDDLSEALGSILSSPESMERLKGLASSLLGDATEEGDTDTSADTSQLPSIPEEQKSDSPQVSPLGGIDLNMIAKLMPLLSQLNQEDDNTKLLKALRPHLHTDRQKRLDEAAKLMQLVKLLPIIRQQGLF